MQRDALHAQTGRRTLGPLAYAMPIMPAVLTFGPLILVIPAQSISLMIVAVILGIGLGILWACIMRIAQRLDQLTEGSREAPSGESVPPIAQM